MARRLVMVFVVVGAVVFGAVACSPPTPNEQDICGPNGCDSCLNLNCERDAGQ